MLCRGSPQPKRAILALKQKSSVVDVSLAQLVVMTESGHARNPTYLPLYMSTWSLVPKSNS
jgi:hypothetical protein